MASVSGEEKRASVSHIMGEMSIYRAGDIHNQLSEALAESPLLHLDLSEVTEFDTAGLQMLLAARKSAEAAHGALRIVNPSVAVSEVLRLLHLGAQLEPLDGQPGREVA